MCGLSERDINTINGIFGKYPDINSVYVFGSRAKGTHKQGSDIDLVIMNNQISIDEMVQLKNDFEESSLPYFVDIVDYSAIQNPALKEHIQKVKKKIYSRV